MSGEHEQQPKLHGKQCYGLTWACCIHVLLFAKYFSGSISKTQPIYFFTSLSVEVSGYQSLSILRDVISDNMSLVGVRMTLSFSLFLSFFPLSKWNSCKILETLLFNITRADFPSCWQHSFRFLLMRKGSFWFSLPTTEVGKKKHCDIYHFLIYNLSEILPCPNTDVLHSSSLSRQIEYTDFRNLFFVRSFSTFQPLSSFWIHLHQNKYCSR